MINYELLYDDNLNEKFNNIIEQYNQYIKLYYIDKSKCPVDIKTILEKERNGNNIKMHCNLKGGKVWILNMTMPKIVDLHNEKIILSNDYNKKAIELKIYIKDTIESRIYNSKDDNVLKSKINEIKIVEVSLQSINNIFELQKKNINDMLFKQQEIIKEITEIYKNRKNIYKNINHINKNIKNNLFEIFKNEKNPNEKRLNEISKNLNISINTIKDWLLWFLYINNYLDKNKELEEINDNISIINKKYERINKNYIIKKPEINIVSENKKNKENKKIKIKIRKNK